MIRQYLVSRVDTTLVQLDDQLSQPQSTSTPIATVSAASRAEAESIATSSYPDISLSLTRISESNQAVSRLAASLTSIK